MMDDLLIHIDPSQIASYLTGTGWEPTTSRRPNIGLFHKSVHDRMYEITLPLKRDFKDYLGAIYSVVEQLAQTEERDREDVVTRLATADADVIRIRRVEQATSNGTIPFDSGIRLFENARKALYAVVCDLLEPRLYHKKLSLKAADAFIERCSFGQTERGSYIATIICPFTRADEASANQLTLEGHKQDFSESFTRQVTSKLMRSLDIVHNAVENHQVESLQKIDLDKPNDLISGNLLEALIELNGSDSTAEIEISAQWSALAPINKEQIPNSVKFNQEDFPPIERIVEKIQAEVETKTKQGVFVGRISIIQAEPNIQQRTNGEVTLNTFDTDGKVIKPRMVVSPEELELAMRAMKEGLNVRVRGMLITRKRTKVLEYTSMELLD